jgi:hypothetical protein
MSFKPIENPAATFPLDQPIQAYGTQITEIAVRAPTAGDLFRAGNPVISFDVETGAYRWDEQKAMAMLSRLSGIPYEGSLEHLAAEDAVYCWEGIGPFFVKGLRKVLEVYYKAKAEAAAASSTRPDEPLVS